MTVDPIGALTILLRADADIQALVDSRVFSGELPRGENVNMPRAAIVISSGGGGQFGNGYQDFSDVRVNALCYGDTEQAAWVLGLTLKGVLKQMRRTVSNGVLLHWVKETAGPATGRDPVTEWPTCIAVYRLLAAEITAA